MHHQLVDDLALQIRDYPRYGGPRPEGMQLLQRGRSRVVPVTWPRNSTVPNDVAELLLGIQFHNKKAVAKDRQKANLGLDYVSNVTVSLTYKGTACC